MRDTMRDLINELRAGPARLTPAEADHLCQRAALALSTLNDTFVVAAEDKLIEAKRLLAEATERQEAMMIGARRIAEGLRVLMVEGNVPAEQVDRFINHFERAFDASPQ